MELSKDTQPEQQGRLHRVMRALLALTQKAGQGFAEDNRGHELGSREDRIVAVTHIPDNAPKDW